MFQTVVSPESGADFRPLVETNISISSILRPPVWSHQHSGSSKATLGRFQQRQNVVALHVTAKPRPKSHLYPPTSPRSGMFRPPSVRNVPACAACTCACQVSAGPICSGRRASWTRVAIHQTPATAECLQPEKKKKKKTHAHTHASAHTHTQ